MKSSLPTFSVSPDDLRLTERVPGVAAYLRARDEEEYLAATVESHLPFFDEIVITVHDCKDATPEIAEDLAARYPNNVRVAHYQQEIATRSSSQHIGIPDDSPRSYANFCNWAMCQTRHQIIARIDADHIAIPSEMERLLEHIRQRLNPEINIGFSGINWFPIDSSLFIKREDALTFGDHSFFYPSENTWFHYDEKFGSAIMASHQKGIKPELWKPAVFHHMKCLKKTGGYGTYDTSNPDANVHQVAQADAQRVRGEVMSLWEAMQRLPGRFPEADPIYREDLEMRTEFDIGSPTLKERLRTSVGTAKRALLRQQSIG